MKLWRDLRRGEKIQAGDRELVRDNSGWCKFEVVKDDSVIIGLELTPSDEGGEYQRLMSEVVE